MPKINHPLTKIIATVGPATENTKMLKSIYKEGVDIFRINLSHGTREEHSAKIEKILLLKKELSKNGYRSIEILIDTRGFETRVASIGDGISVKKNEEVIMTYKNNKVSTTKQILPITQSSSYEFLSKGDPVVIDEGKIFAEVVKVSKKDKCVVIKIKNPGHITYRRHINFPGADMGLSALVKEDKDDLKYYLQQFDIDYVAMSFVEKAQDIEDLKKIISKYSKKETKVISKIESRLALENIKEILESSFGIMVARGDLGSEIPIWQLPKTETQLIRLSQRMNKFVIVATEMLQSMVKNPSPTRAEVVDIAFAAVMGANAVMLSAETGIGNYPVESVEMMRKVLLESEEEVYS